MLVGAAGLWLACGGDYGEASGSGDRYEPCYANGTCNAGLVCADGICIVPGAPNALGDGGGDGSSASSGGGSSTSSSSSSSTSSSASSSTSSSSSSSSGNPFDAGADGGGVTPGPAPGPGALAIAAAICLRENLCNPKFSATWLSPTHCRDVMAFDPLHFPGSAVTDADLSACAATITANKDCTKDTLSLADACYHAKPGSLLDGEACLYAFQCFSGTCALPDIAAPCAECMTGKAVDDPCDASLGDCAFGLNCVSGECKAPVAPGGDCGGEDVCQNGFACTGGKCLKTGEVGVKCGGALGVVCRSGLECLGDTCAELGWLKPDDPCDPLDSYCANGICLATGVCQAAPGLGELCDDVALEGPSCNGDFVCSDGVCVRPQLATTCP